MLQVFCGRRRAVSRACHDGVQMKEISRIASFSCFSGWPLSIFHLFPVLLDLPFRQTRTPVQHLKQIGLMPCHSPVLTHADPSTAPNLGKTHKKRREKKPNTVVKTYDAEMVVHETKILWPTILFQFCQHL